MPANKNERISFNDDIVAACFLAKGKLRQLGYAISFVNAANNVVLSDEKFVRSSVVNFLQGLTLNTGLTNPNNNVKNGRYPLVIGGNNTKRVGDTLIDTGLLTLAKVARELYQVKDFSSDLLVL